MTVTVAGFLKKFELVEGDNKACRFSLGDLEVKELAWRENKGEMPCDGELWVDVVNDREQVFTERARRFCWSEEVDDFIVGWRPSIKNWEKEEVMESENIKLANDALQKMEEGKSNFHSLDDARGILKSRREAYRDRTGEENQIEKSISENEVAYRDTESLITNPTTAEGKRELAAQLMKEASDLERQEVIEKTANQHVLDLINLGIIQPSQVKEKTKEVIEFYSTF